MIRLSNMSKVFRYGRERKVVCDRVNLAIPTDRSVALLGRNGVGKTTLLKLIAGTMDVTSGRILRTGQVSWPVGFAGSFHGELTGAQNAKFVARIYGRDTDEMCDFVREFAELGPHFDLPFRTYSAGMKSRLAFGVSMAIPFDTYLVDEITAVGDAAFKEKSSTLFKARMASAGAIVVSHSAQLIRNLCDAAIVLEAGKMTYFADVNRGIEQHQRNLAGNHAETG